MSKEAMKLALEALLPKAIWNESIEGVFDVPLNEAAHAVVAIRKALTDLPEPVQHTYASKQATKCAGCGEHKHTPLRIDAMGGYVCLTCIDRKLGSLLGEFGYPKPEQPAQQEPVSDRENAIIRFALHQFMSNAYSHMNAAAQVKDSRYYTKGAVEKFAKDAKNAEELLSRLQFKAPQPAQRKPWVGLTEQEAAECWSTSTVRTWQAIEAKLREKNNG